MSVLLIELDESVQSVIAQLECDEYEREDRHRAIRWAANYFLRATKAARALLTKATVSGTDTLDVTTADSSFEASRITAVPYIDSTDNPVSVRSWQYVLEQRALYGSASGRPELIGWQTPAVAQLYPNPDAVYTITIPYWQTLTSFTIGTPSKSQTLNLPASYIDDIAMGAAVHLLRFSPGREWATMRTEFEAACKKAKSEFSPMAPMIAMGGSNIDNSYDRQGRL